MVKVSMLVLVLTSGLGYSLIAIAEPLDQQIQKMHELQLQQNTFDENLKSRAERNKIPEFRQKLLDSEKDLDRSDRLDILQEEYQTELMRLDLEARRLKARVDKTIVDETDFTYDREQKKVEIQLKRLELESRLLDLARKRTRVASEERFISMELAKKAAEIKVDEARGESKINISTGVRAGLEGLGEAAKNGDLFD
ncbi:MAG: hypothetical protein CMO22_08145 [Thiotrichales bacterium]|nr:hypothetical protein [Thiotrichales bacterium]OUX49356.1 MAG: hypothetical protein CBE42_07530 [Methylococcaceae bacterium TMED282]|tara:strand:- start:2870 stop:3460 length:591 start_codon:yes stop_codon:yes gene_type:complete